MSDAEDDSLGSDSEDYTEIFKRPTPKTEAEKIAEAIRAKQYMLLMAGLPDNSNAPPLSVSPNKLPQSSQNIAKPRSPTSSRQPGTRRHDLPTTHHSPSTSTTNPPTSPQKPPPIRTPTPKPQQEKPAKKTRTRKYGIGQERQLGPDSGSMDAFYEVGFETCTLFPTLPKGRAPIAHMYDPVCLAAKGAKGAKASTQKPGTSIGEPVSRAASGRKVPLMKFDAGKDADGGIIQKKIGPVATQEARLFPPEASLYDTWPSEKVEIERKGVREASSLEQNEARSSSAALVGKGKGHLMSVTVKETAPGESIAAPIKGQGQSPNSGNIEQSIPIVDLTSLEEDGKAPFKDSTIEPCTPKKPTPYRAPRSILSNGGIKLSTKAVTSKQSGLSKNQQATASVPYTVLKGKKKRALCDIDVGTLFTPSQIGSRSEQERLKRRRHVSTSHQDAHTSMAAAAATVTHDATPENGLPERYPAHVPTPDHCDATSTYLPKPATAEPSADDYSSLFGDTEGDRAACAAQLAPEAETRALSPTQSVQTITSTSRQQTPNYQTVHMTGAPDAPSSPTLRPTIARKTISSNSCTELDAAGHCRVTPDEGDNNDEEGEPAAPGVGNESATSGAQRFHEVVDVDSTDEILYQYLVTRFDFGPNVAEEDAVKTEFGPYFTMSEANESAQEEVGRSYIAMVEATQWIGPPVDLGEARGFGSDIGVAIDGTGCRTWRCVNVGGRGVVAAVRREIKPKRSVQGGSIPASAFSIPRRVYLVLQILHNSASTQTRNEGDVPEETDIEVETLGAFTVLDLANKKAGFAVLAFSNAHLGVGPLDEIERKEQTWLMRKHLQELERDDERFDQMIVTREGEVGRVWVVSIALQGPRN